MFIFVALGIYITGFIYIGWRLIGPTKLERRTKRFLWLGLGLVFAAIFASLILTRTMDSWSSVLSWIAYPLLGFLSSLFFLLIIRDIILLLTRGVAWLRGRSAKRSKDEKEVDHSRRAHLVQMTNIGVVGVAAAVTSYGIFEARRKPGIVEVTVPIARLPKEFVGFRIVQLSDLHAGLTIGREWIETVAQETMALRPDMIAFTGDLVDGSVAQLRNDVAPMGELRAPYGKFFITGNHEYYSGVDEWMAHAGRLGYDVLMNEHRIVEKNGARLVLGGVTDFTGGQHSAAHRSDPAATFRDAPPELVRIFLAHQPKTLRQTDGVDFDLMLSGHTHGGQFFPWNLATAMDQPYLSGLHRPNGKWIYVSKGTGYWGPPVRLGARSEITVITLTDGNAV